ncbi:MAG: hypothetical protein M1821_008257 [Bathelium mastoideum]|nr:MAG: hypothetical protein M1821_008257 [Bathelium mastoideum]
MTFSTSVPATAASGQGSSPASFETSGGLPATAAPPSTSLSLNSQLHQVSQHFPAERERSATPHQSNPNIAPQHLFDQVTTFDAVTQPSSHSPSLPQFSLRHPSPAPSHLSASSSQLNGTGGHLEPPQTYDAILALNTSLKTRVSELEVINDLFRGRVTELERSEKDARDAEKASNDEVARLSQELEEVQQREQSLKKRLEQLEARTQDGVLDGNIDAAEQGEKRAKRRRLNEDEKEI